MKLYTTKQAGEYLGIHQDTVRNYINNGYINAKKLGNQWVITKKELDKRKKGGASLSDNALQTA